MSGYPRARPRPAAILAGVLAAAAASTAAGCGAGAKQAPGVAVAAVTERDFHIEAPSTVKAGDLVLHIHNEGPDQHELIVAPLHGTTLPMRTDGFTIDEESIERSEPGSLPPGRAGAERTLTVHLAPGRYVFFCNMAGHYLGGMHTIVDVTR
jgi:uncharacterized cupredoxin-like copper-binding protein